MPKNVHYLSSASIANDGPWTTVLGEDATRNESEHLSMVVRPSGDCFDPLGHIIHCLRYTLSPLKVGKVP